MQKRATAGAFRAVLAHDVILLRRQPVAPFGVGQGEGKALLVHIRSFRPAQRVPNGGQFHPQCRPPRARAKGPVPCPPLTSLSCEEQPAGEEEGRDQHASRPQHVGEEMRHAHALVPGDGIDHEVRRVADIGVGAHEDRARRDRGEHGRAARHQRMRVAAGKIEEDEIGRRIVEKGRQQCRSARNRRAVGAAVGVGHQRDQRRKRALLAGVQHGESPG